jgi:hypothetical protein
MGREGVHRCDLPCGSGGGAVDQLAAVRSGQSLGCNGECGVADHHRFCAIVHPSNVLRNSGYEVSLTKATGDFGVHLIAVKGGVRTAVQCKRYGGRISGSAVQQVVTGATYFSNSMRVIVSIFSSPSFLMISARSAAFLAASFRFGSARSRLCRKNS